MQGLAQVFEAAAAMIGAALSLGLAYLSAALFVLVLVGFYAWFVPKRSRARSLRRPPPPKPTRCNPAAFLERAP